MCVPPSEDNSSEPAHAACSAKLSNIFLGFAQILMATFGGIGPILATARI